MAELIIAEELKRWRWQEADLKTRPKCNRAVQNQPVSEVNKFIAERARLLGP
jgi:hypothetical protein